MNFTENKRSRLGERVFLNESYAAVDPIVEGLKDIKLMPHQQRNIAAMIDLENNPKITYVPGRVIYNSVGAVKSSTTRGGRLAEKLGTGKTFMVLGTILLNPMPKILPEILHFNFETANVRRMRNNFQPYFTRKYKKMLKTNIIFVSSKTLHQWKSVIERHTNLSIFPIENVLDIRKFEIAMQHYTHTDTKTTKTKRYDYDITLIKNGTSSKRGVLGYKESGTVQSIITSIAQILDHYQLICKRIFIDDYDTIGIKPDALLPSGVFTWVISSTDRKSKISKTRGFKYKSLLDYLVGQRPRLNLACFNEELHTDFNISCVPAYTDRFIHIGTPVYYVYECDNPNATAMRVLNAMNMEQSREVWEALNGDSIGEAARIVGTDCNNVADLIDHILGKTAMQYKDALRKIAVVKKHIKNLPALNPHKYDRYPSKELEKIRNNYKNKPKWNSPPIKSVLKDHLIDAREDKKKYGMAMDRVQASLQVDNCIVCGDSMAESDVVVMKHCGRALCSDCGIIGSNLSLDRDIKGKCSHCRRDITIRDIIFLNRKVGLKFDLEDEEILEDMEPPSEPENVPNPTPNTKLEILMAILNGANIQREERNMTIPQIVVDSSPLPLASADKSKFLIVSNYKEQLDKISLELANHDKQFVCLKGNSKSTGNALHEFRTRVPIMLLKAATSRVDGAGSGIDIPFVTDIIFMHKFIDNFSFAQALARAQRMGRQTKLRVHFIWYRADKC